MTTQHSTGKRCPRSPRRDATGRNKAELNPWTLSGATSAQADRSRTAPQSNPGSQGLGPEARDNETKAPAAEQQAPSSPWPPLSARTRLVPGTNKQRGARLGVLSPQAHYPDRRVVTSAGPTPRCAWWERSTDRSRQGVKSPKCPLAESPDSTKASGATVGDHD